MKEHSIRFTEVHFDAKASRYQAAIRSSPLARTFEQLPFLLFLGSTINRDPHELVAADLLCGSGFLTHALRSCFRRIVGIDVSREMLAYFPVGENLERLKAGLDEHPEVLSTQVQPDVILALAGLHHVYEVVDGIKDPEASDALQQAVLMGWARSLPQHGVMIVADVTDPSVPITYSSEGPLLDAISPAFLQVFEKHTRDLGTSLPLAGPLFSELPASISAYIDHVHAIAPCSREAQPGLWFRDVVARYGSFGHTDHFADPAVWIEPLVREGFRVRYHEIPTPWVFASADALVFFFYEKFVFGPPVDSVRDIPSGIRSLIEKKTRRYLGLSELASGAVAVGWRLGFYVVSPPPS